MHWRVAGVIRGGDRIAAVVEGGIGKSSATIINMKQMLGDI